jgi:CheY-like chemotaxis protein
MDLEKTMVTALENSSRTPFTDSLEDRNGHLPGHQKFTILLAEDNVINQKVAARLLEKQGHTVTVANNGSEAVTAMFRESFDIVLMDVQMPEMSGLEATRLFREYEKTSSRRQLIVAVTAYALPGDREKCLEAGMDDYISKPFNVHELCALLNHIVAARTVQA